MINHIMYGCIMLDKNEIKLNEAFLFKMYEFSKQFIVFSF